MQTLTNSGTTTDYNDKSFYKVPESERKTKFDAESSMINRVSGPLLTHSIFKTTNI